MPIVSDRRVFPRIATAVFIKATLVMFWARLGSLHGLRQSEGSRFWKQWLHHKMPSEDSLGRVSALLEKNGLQRIGHDVYTKLKRNKALQGRAGLTATVLDGHETHASYRRHCEGCLQRKINTQTGERIQYYHRNVTLMLLGEKLRLLLDVEAQRPGENEIAAARRLLERVLKSYPRAFRLILADALYAGAPFINYLWSHHKYVLIVLKDERSDIYQDSQGLFKIHEPIRGSYRDRECWWWDIGDLTSWSGVGSRLRVVRSFESYGVKRQATGKLEQQTAEWMWVTNLPTNLASTAVVVLLGHARWDIENYGFNELVNGWHADHVYKHHPMAIDAFYLLAFLAFNLFHAFLELNLKPVVRKSKSDFHWARLMAAEIFQVYAFSGFCRSP